MQNQFKLFDNHWYFVAVSMHDSLFHFCRQEGYCTVQTNHEPCRTGFNLDTTMCSCAAPKNHLWTNLKNMNITKRYQFFHLHEQLNNLQMYSPGMTDLQSHTVPRWSYGDCTLTSKDVLQDVECKFLHVPVYRVQTTLEQ